MTSADAIVVVGAAGFIGRALARRLAAAGQNVVAAMRHPVALGDGITLAALGEIGAATDWAPLLPAPARSCISPAAPISPRHRAAALDQRRGCRRGRSLARAAARPGSSALMLLSSIKVLGDASTVAPFPPGRSPASPGDAYGLAKWRIEDGDATALARGPGADRDAAAAGLRPRRQSQFPGASRASSIAACRCRLAASSTAAAWSLSTTLSTSSP